MEVSDNLPDPAALTPVKQTTGQEFSEPPNSVWVRRGREDSHIYREMNSGRPSRNSVTKQTELTRLHKQYTYS
jgi:hypothetical protein